MSNLRVISDLHLEFGKFVLPVLPDDANSILVIAGDLAEVQGKGDYHVSFFEKCVRFKHILFVPGNHEYYNGSFPTEIFSLKTKTEHIENLTILASASIVIDDIVFIGATLWTNMNNASPLTILSAKESMNDFSLIWDKNEFDVFHPETSVFQFNKDLKFITEQLDQNKNLKSVVITHHAPSSLSCAEKYQGHALNGAFYSDLGNFICYNKPTIWIHGHTHDSYDYMINTTRVVCNPKGYDNENLQFDPNFLIEV